MKNDENKKIKAKSWQSIIIYFLLLFLLPVIMSTFYMTLSGISNADDFPAWFRLYTQVSISLLGLIIIVLKLHGNFLKEKLDENINFILVAIITIFIIGIGIIWDIILPTPTNQLELKRMMDSNILLLCFSSVMVAPFVEELVFRVNLKAVLKNSILFILLSSLLFGFMHGFSFAPEAIIYYIIGAIMAITYVKTNSIWSCITIHFLNNLFWFVVMLIRL